MSITLIQITDSHLVFPSDQLFKGYVPRDTFNQVLKAATNRYPHVDAVLLTGDLVQDDARAYSVLQQCLDEFARELDPNRIQRTLTRSKPLQLLAVPGNHDPLDAFITAMDCIPNMHQDHLLISHWEVIAVHTPIEGQTHGCVAGLELKRLRARLEHSTASHQLIAMHHPPVAVGSQWMDDIGLKQADAFWDALTGSRVRAVVCGHIHQELNTEVSGIRVLGTPSSVVQFKAHSHDFSLDTQLHPGYRVIELFDDGSLKSEIHRL
jgi:Icc protein